MSGATLCDIEDLIGNYKSQLLPTESDAIIKFKRSQLLEWYRSNRRLLPWRGDNTDIVPSPYGTWVSEIMLQQTRVETVIDYWKRWMIRFPTLQTLAVATPDEVNQLWAGLGYYRRAQQLLKGAQYVMNEYNGVIPSTIPELLKIPGIGPYTAGAIASIAFNKSEPLVDGNVIRVFSRLYGITAEIGGAGGGIEKTCWSIAKSLVDLQDPAAFNQSLMELGATVCKPTSPSCDTCPLNTVCVAKTLTEYKQAHPSIVDLPSEVTYFPRKVAKKKPIEVIMSVCVLITQQSPQLPLKYLFTRRPAKGLLANQWEFPNVIISEKESASTNNEDDENDEDEDEQINNNHNAVKLEESESWNKLKEHFDNKLDILISRNCNVDVIDVDKIYLQEIDSAIKYSELLNEPIVHIFSHQRHTMHITVKHVDSGVLTLPYYNSTDSNEATMDVSKGRWMTAEEITSEGITTGCKKILNEVIKCSTGGSVKKSKKTKASSDDSTDVPDNIPVVEQKVFSNVFEKMLNASSNSKQIKKEAKPPANKKIKIEK